MNTTSQVNKCNTRNRPVKTNISPENKPTPQLKLIKDLSKLVIQIVNAKFGGDRDLIHFLISYYDNTSNNVFTSELFSGKNDEERMDIIQKHCEMFTYKQPGNKSRISYFRGPKDMNLTIDLNSIEKTLNFAYLMYLDMEHDGTLPVKNMTFDDFCKGSYSDGKKEIKTPVWYFFGSGIDIQPKVTPFISKMEDIMGKSATGKESRIKASFEQIYDKSNAVKNAIELNKSEVTPYIIKGGNFLYWLVDQEDKARTATRTINRTAQTVSRPRAGGGVEKRVKSIYPMITVANFMDPGVDLIIDSAKADSELVMMHKRKEPTSRLTYNYHQPKFTIEHELGKTNLEVYYSQQLDKIVKGSNKPKRIGRGYGIYLSNSMQTKRFRNKKDPECVFRLSGKMSKDAAKRINTSQARLSKFLGDFLQVLTAVRTIKNTQNRQNRDTYHYALTTGDTMMANMFLYICTVNGITPKLWFLTSTQGTAKVIGLNNIIKIPNRQNAGRAGSQITGVPSERPNSERVNNKNTATSSGNKNGKKNGNGGLAGMPQNRRLNSVLEGSGNTINKRNTRKSPNVNEGTGESNGTRGNNRNRAFANMIMKSQGQKQIKRTPIRVVNENKGVKRKRPNNPNNILAAALANQGVNNKNKNNNGPPPVRGPNAQSGVGSRYSIAGNNKNGNVSSGNSQPSAEQRKKLLKNLKSKRVPNRTIESLMKNYNNKKMSYNQVIREGNNIGQKIIAGNRAQRMGTLRNRP